MSGKALKEILFIGPTESILFKKDLFIGDLDVYTSCFQSGLDALEHILDEGMPDLIVMDMLTDEINGFHFAYLVTHLLGYVNQKIMIFSEHAYENNVAHAAKSGASAFLSNNCSDEDFRTRARAILESIKEGALEEIPNWAYLGSNLVEDYKQAIYFEQPFSKNRSEIVKVIRSTRKLGVDSIKIKAINQTEFEDVRNQAFGKQSRFVFTQRNHEALKDAGMNNLTQEITIGSDQLFNFRKLKDLASSNDNLKALFDVNQEICGAVDNTHTLNKVINRISTLPHVTRASIIVVSSKNDKGLVIASNDVQEDDRFTVDLNRYPEIMFSLRNKEIVYIDDIENSRLLMDEVNLFKHLGFRSIIIIPIWHKGTTVAVLYLRSTKGKEIMEDQNIVYLQLLANTLSQPIAKDMFLNKIKLQNDFANS